MLMLKGDIYTGKVYQEHIQNNRLGKIHQSSYCFCTDGVRFIYTILYNYFRNFKKSDTSIWPIWLINNELGPNLRFKKENVKLFGLWFGSFKPHMNTFLTPMTQMFIDAWYDGMYNFGKFDYFQ
jgi:hypothetical protein